MPAPYSRLPKSILDAVPFIFSELMWKDIQNKYPRYLNYMENSIYNMQSFMLKKKERNNRIFLEKEMIRNSGSFLGELDRRVTGNLLFTLLCPLNKAPPLFKDFIYLRERECTSSGREKQASH